MSQTMSIHGRWKILNRIERQVNVLGVSRQLPKGTILGVDSFVLDNLNLIRSGRVNQSIHFIVGHILAFIH